MGRTGSTIRARLSILINVMLEIQNKKGYVTLNEIAERLSLTSRAVRDYMDMLATLGIVEYAGVGRFLLNRESVKNVMGRSFLEPRVMYTLEDFMAPEIFNELKYIAPIEERVKRILERMNMEYLISDKLRNTLLKMKIDDELRSYGFVGDRLILKKVAKDRVLHDEWFAGTYGGYNLKDYALLNFAVLEIAYLSAASYIGYYLNNILDASASKSIVKPRIEEYHEREPFLPEDPFYEMTSTFPELLSTGRRIAARYLMEILHYDVDISTIENFSDKTSILYHHGTLIPHGFVISSRELIKLKKRAHELFFKLLDFSRKRNVLLVGVSMSPYDNYIIRTLSKLKKLKIGETSDLNLMLGILEDGDATTPILRIAEQGRPRVQDWYEFYVKIGTIVLKVEMITKKPLETQKEILRSIYTLTVPSPREGILPGPGVVGTAQEFAMRHIAELQRTVELAIRSGVKSFFQITSDMKKEK